LCERQSGYTEGEMGGDAYVVQSDANGVVVIVADLTRLSRAVS